MAFLDAINTKEINDTNYEENALPDVTKLVGKGASLSIIRFITEISREGLCIRFIRHE